jgi:dihydrolipoamide dehydrogenase
LVALGRRPNMKHLALENLGTNLRADGLPEFNPETLQVGDLRVFIAGDANGILRVLHETWNDGLVAGYNVMQPEPQLFARRTSLLITFADPNICIAGRSFASLHDCSIVTGSVSFITQGRAIIREENKGLLKLYADSVTGKLLGSEMVAPAGEHLAHLIAWAIQQQQTVHDILTMPFYHPVIEEGLRKAVRDIAKALPAKRAPAEALLYDDSPADGLC